MAETKSMDKLTTGFVAILVGVVLVPIIASVVATANVTGTTATVVSLIPEQHWSQDQYCGECSSVLASC